MSLQAVAYVKELTACPDGAALNPRQKLLAFTLADYHNTDLKVAWPSVPTLARETLASLSQVKRDLAYLEEHRLIRRLHPHRMGRGWVCAYEFLALDAIDRSEKGVQGEPLFCATERGPKGVQGKAERGPKGVQKGFRFSDAIRKNEELKQKQNEEHGGLIFSSRQIDLAVCERCGGVGMLHQIPNIPGPRLIPCPNCSKKELSA
jgi:hypothetical protein